MIRPATLICAGVAAVAGLYLYHVKHQTQLLERTIAKTNQSIEAARERTGVLRAEWTLMNDPERLADLAGQFLKLGTVSPRQFTTVADLGSRLPAPRAIPAAPEVSTDQPAAEAEPGDTGAEAPLPLPPPPAPAPPAPRVAATPAPRPATATPSGSGGAPASPATAAATQPGTVTQSGSGTPTNAAPATATVATAAPATPRAVAQTPAAAPPRAQPAAAAPQASAPRQMAAPATAPVTAPAVAPASPGSALGMARGIVAPPVPVGGDIHLTRGN